MHAIMNSLPLPDVRQGAEALALGLGVYLHYTQLPGQL